MNPLPHPAPWATLPWRAFARRVLHDYPRPARAAWLAITTAGACALGWSAWQLQAQAPGWPLLLALVLVALASSLSIQLPRSSYSVSIGDVFVFGVLTTFGPAAAVLASGVDAVAGTVRITRRWSSLLATPAAAMAAMAACAAAFGAVRAVLGGQGLEPGSATLTALLLVALLPFALSLCLLMGMTSLKLGKPLEPWRWLADSSWMAAIYLASALIAGLVHLQAQRQGAAPLLVSALAAIAMMALLRTAVRRQEAERRQQQALVAQAQHEATLSHERFAAAFSHAAIGMVVVRPDGRMLQANQAFLALLKLDEASVVGRPFDTLLGAVDAQQLRQHAQSALAAAGAAGSGAPALELPLRRADVQALWVAVHCSRYEDPDGGGPCLIYQLHDVTSRRVAEGRLNHLAHHDDLTGLANRHAFHQRLDAAVARSRAEPGWGFAVLYLDLDRFKLVNDSLGHGTGNELLREVAARLRASLPPSALVARLGGDEFAALLDGVADTEAARAQGGAVLAALARPLRLRGTELTPGVSIGVTVGGGEQGAERGGDELLRDADLAMYEAKAAGRGRVVCFDRAMHQRVADKLALESDLRRALGEGRLGMHFQPIYQLQPRRLSGFEALARWEHPQRGPISPGVFVALAEESGQIEALTDWVIEHAVSELARWRAGRPDWQHLVVHVNISGHDLARDSLVSHVEQVLQRHRVAPGSLTLELTETTLMSRLEVSLGTMARLRALGVRFSIDDFGTGYSSLAYLARLPIDSLKIDRSFVATMHESRQNLEIVRAMLTLGRTLGHKVIAEGVETEQQLALLRELGVPEAQGYLLARPLPGEQAAALLGDAGPAPGDGR